MKKSLFGIRCSLNIGTSFFCIGIILFFISLPVVSSATDWKSYLYKRVSITNQTKDVIYLENLNNTGLFIRFLVHNRKVSLKLKPPLYQVDQGEVYNLKNEKTLKTAKTHWLRFRIAQNKDDHNSKFTELLNGKRLVFQYYPSKDVMKEAVFDLEGIKEAVQTLW